MPIEHSADHFGMQAGAEQFPKMVVIGMSYVCNARCPSCPYNNNDTLRKRYSDVLLMPENVFKKIADECGKYAAVIRVSGGGEPLLHPKAVELLCYAKNVGAKIGLITNGSRLTTSVLISLLTANVDVLEFSADAPDEETYNRVRPGLDWKNLVNTVSLAKAMRDTHYFKTKIIVSVIDQTGVDVEKAKAFWGAHCDRVQVRKYLTWGLNESHAGDATPYLDPAAKIPCPWLFERLNIDSRGDVTICGEDLAFKYKFANVMTQSIESIWLGPEMSALRKLHLEHRGDEHVACKDCPDWKYRSWQHNYWKLIK
jgi:radical SAM protein with 4Fe4S-binding SPASM domain